MKLPKGWKICDAVSLCNLITKGTTPRNTVSRETQGNIPFLRVQNLSFNGKLDFSSGLLFVAGDTNSSELARSRLYPGDVLTNIVGPPLGKVSVVTNEYPEWNMNQAIAVFRTNESCVSRFLSYYLQSQAAKNWLSSQSKKTSGQQNLTLETCNSLPVPLPPLTEQHKIAEILSTWDEALEKFDALIAAKERRKKGLMQQLLTGKRRVKSAAGKWRKTRIGELLQESRLPGGHGLTANKITVKLYGRGVVAKQERLQGSQNTKYFVRRAGQFIYSKLDFLNGAFGIVPENLNGFESTLDLPAFDVGHECDLRWLLAYVSRPSFYKRQLGAAAGGRKARRVNPHEFLSIEVKLPSLPEQRAIADILDACDEELRLLRGQQAAIERQKRGLMQRLLTGAVRVRTEKYD